MVKSFSRKALEKFEKFAVHLSTIMFEIRGESQAVGPDGGMSSPDQLVSEFYLHKQISGKKNDSENSVSPCGIILKPSCLLLLILLDSARAFQPQTGVQSVC